MKIIKKIFIITFSLSTSCYPIVQKKLLIGSPVRQKPAILKEFLQSLDELEKNSYTADFIFIDDNIDQTSSNLLQEFAQNHTTIINHNESISAEAYICNEVTHFWKESIVWKVAAFKDSIIEYARNNNYDYLFLIDSDMVLHPYTIEQLISADKDIIAEIWWTNWAPELPKQASVWLYDNYTQLEIGINEKLSNEEAIKRYNDFMLTLTTPGVYEIGGLCTCTLINKNALHEKISFKRIRNLTFWGEDRHFCTRAIALGLHLFVDTHYPAYHIYRESDLQGVTQYKENCKKGIYTI